MVHLQYINVVVFILLVQDSNFCYLFLGVGLKQACPSEKIRSLLLMNRAIGLHISLNASWCLSRCRQNGVTRGFCLNVRRRLDCVRHVRCSYDTRPCPVSAHVRRLLEKLRHLASVRLTCMQTGHGAQITTMWRSIIFHHWLGLFDRTMLVAQSFNI